MGVLAGMDEAGYGPNLGPLVISATAWDVNGDPGGVDLWGIFAEIVSSSRTSDKLQVADSKTVYTAGKSIARLECSVLCLLGLAGKTPRTLKELCSDVMQSPLGLEATAPWLQDLSLSLPVEADPDRIRKLTSRWSEVCSESGAALQQVRSDIVSAERFNALVREYDNKSTVLSRVSLALLAQVCPADGKASTLIVCDKHGGRNRYDGLLSEALGHQLVFRLQESAELSCYRSGPLEVRFQAKGESVFSVAVASMVSKYIRELIMLRFNDYWTEQMPELRPTRGYPVDAKRFDAEVAGLLSELGISKDVFWRSR